MPSSHYLAALLCYLMNVVLNDFLQTPIVLDVGSFLQKRMESMNQCLKAAYASSLGTFAAYKEDIRCGV